MISVALRMLTGDRTRYLGLLIGVSFAALMITQQAGIFLGLAERTYSFISDTSAPHLWVMDPEVEYIGDVKPVLSMKLYQVRGVDGVDWAVPMYRSWARMRLPSGEVRMCQMVGLDDATLTGGPAEMVVGALDDLHQPDSVIVEENELAGKFLMKPATPEGPKRPLMVGDTLELNDHRARLVGTYKASPGFFWEPIIYTTYSRALTYLPQERRTLTFILVGAKPGEALDRLAARIESSTGLKAYTREQFSRVTAAYIFEKTGILVNFGLAVALGFVIGVLITGQTFYNFTVDNLRHFAALKAMGASNARVVGMVVAQSLSVGAVGYGIGLGFAAFVGHTFLSRSTLSFTMPWQLMVFTALAIGVVCVISAVLSVRRVMVVDPAIVFKGA